MATHRNVKRFATEAIVPVQLDRVYRLLQAVEYFPRWIPNVIDASRLTVGPSRPGSRFVFHVEVLRFRLRLEGMITECEESSLVSFRTTSGPSLTGRWLLWTEGDGTRAQFSMEFQLPGGLIGMAARFVPLENILADAARRAFDSFQALASDATLLDEGPGSAAD